MFVSFIEFRFCYVLLVSFFSQLWSRFLFIYIYILCIFLFYLWYYLYLFWCYFYYYWFFFYDLFYCALILFLSFIIILFWIWLYYALSLSDSLILFWFSFLFYDIHAHILHGIYGIGALRTELLRVLATTVANKFSSAELSCSAGLSSIAGTENEVSRFWFSLFCFVLYFVLFLIFVVLSLF